MVLHQSFRIGKRDVGIDYPPMVIAEAGVNHNGSLSLAKQLVIQAKRSGADAIKFQTFKADSVATEYAKTAEYQVANTGDTDQLSMLKHLELSDSDFDALRNLCDEEDIIFLSTPTSKSDIDFLSKLDVPAFKIASPDLPSLPLLEYVSGKGKPVILSTGMSSLNEVKGSIDILGKKLEDIAIMQCTSSYPCDLAFVNLNVILSFQEFGIPIGFSDHSLGIGCAIAGSYLGACIIEKHFTLSNKMEGPDHKMSLESNALARLVDGVHKAFERRGKERRDLLSILEKFDPTLLKSLNVALGSHQKQVAPPEEELILKTRKSLVPTRFIKKDTKIPRGTFEAWDDFFSFKRPGTGLAPKYIYQLLGKVAKRDLKKDERLNMADFE